MVRETLKKFELNNAVLEDFDNLMSKHLDEVEELVISEIDAKSKLLNIVGLCINVKTIIIEGDERTNTNNIIANICKPELLENLILNSVKIPSNFSFKKLVSLKMLSLNNIRGSSVLACVKQIVNPEKIEALNFYQVDFAKSSVDCLKPFVNLRYLNLLNVRNCKLNNLEFLANMKKLVRVNIEKNIIDFAEVRNILGCKFYKQITLDMPTAENSYVTNSLEVQEDGRVSVTINNREFENLVTELDLKQINDILLIISSVENELATYIKYLKRVKNKISIAIKDVSCLSSEDAIKMKEELNIKYINIIDFDGVLQYEKDRYCYEIDNYISIRKEFDKLLEGINEEADELLKFLHVYKILGENILYDNILEEELVEYVRENEVKSSNLENGLLKKKCIDSGFAEILKNSLAIFGIEAKIVKGKYVGIDAEHYWNQVKVLDKWYNVDLGLDSKRISGKKGKQSKPTYCLLADKVFYKTHSADYSNIKYCEESIDKKVISTYFKRRFSIKKHMHEIMAKIKRVFKYNKQKALTEGNENEDKK